VRVPLDRWRYRLRARLDGLLAHEPQLGKLLAVTLGMPRAFPGRLELFARTGTTHLVVISGMHITLVAMLVMALAGFARGRGRGRCWCCRRGSWGMLAGGAGHARLRRARRHGRVGGGARC